MLKTFENSALKKVWRGRHRCTLHFAHCHALPAPLLCQPPRPSRPFHCLRLALNLQIRHFTSRDLSVLLWSLATALVKPSNALVKAGIQQSLDMCKDFTPHELADATWAMGSMGWKPGSADTSGWFACIDEASDAMSFIDMMRTAWALTIIRIGGKMMSDGMLARLENGSHAFAGLSCKHIIMYLETLKRLGSVKPGPLLSNAILRGTVTHLDTFSSDQLLQVLDFMQCFEPRPEKQFLLNIVLKLVEKMFACTSKELVSLLTSATNLKLAPLPEAVEAYILRMAKLNLCRFKQSQAAIVRWAMTQLKIEISEDMMRELRCVESSQRYHLKTIVQASGGLLSVFTNVHRFNDRQRRHSMAPGMAPAPGRNLSACIHDSGHERPMPNASARRASVALSGCFIPLANDVSEIPRDKSSRRSSLVAATVVAATAVIAANKMSHSGERRKSSVSQMSGVERAISQPDSCNTDASMRKSSLYGQLWEGPTNRFIHRQETNKLLESEGIPLLSMPLPDAARGRAQVFKRPSSVEIRRPATSIPGCTEEGKDFLRTSSAPQRLKTLHQVGSSTHTF
jgi:hypothetical protein